MASSPRPERCRTHATSLAGWTCEACQSRLCPECVAEQTYGPTAVAVEVCSLCGGRAVRLKHHRSHRSYASRLIDSVRFLVKPSTLFSLVGLGVFCSLMGWFGGFIGWVLMAGGTWAYLFYVFLSSARGVELDVPDFSSLSDIITPLLRGLAGSFYVWAPAVLYVIFSGNWEPGGGFEAALSDPILYLILGWCLFYGPMAFMVAATPTSLWVLLNPVALVLWAFRLGTDYLLALVVVVVSLGLDVLLGLLGGALSSAGVPVVSRTLDLVMPFFMAHVLGQLLFVRGDKLGYGVEEDYYEPVLPGARPQGRLPSKAKSAPPPRREEGGVASRMAAVLSNLEPSAPVGDPSESLRAVVDAVTARDTAGAVLAYRGLESSSHARLAPEQHLFVGRAAASGGDFALAAKAFETAADVAPESPVAPQALVLLARLCAERMSDPARAQSVYRYIVHRYPDTDASRFAAQRLTP
ncbi:tetratricopeptide repeat protein [Hyalangium gracile]|uniref:tetratricopeptide repeat protein n=1 Tax=Hyalangium gracile TaxID=394092 RepID=UPI001CCAA02D|nr:tetratricopeptide repeat protein [Hyalangium gracile]